MTTPVADTRQHVWMLALLLGQVGAGAGDWRVIRQLLAELAWEGVTGSVVPRAETLLAYRFADPPDTPVVRWRDRAWRVPGCSPPNVLAALDTAGWICAAADAAVLDEYGFDIADLVEGILAGAATPLPPRLPTGPAEHVVGLWSPELIASRCRHPKRTLAALAWAAVDVARPDVGARADWWSGEFVAARIDAVISLMPSPVALSNVNFVIARLLRQVIRRSPQVRKRFDLACSERVAEVLSRARHPGRGVVHVDGREVHSVQFLDDRHVLAVDVATSLDAREAPAVVAEAADRLAAVMPGARWTTAGAAHPEVIPDDAEVARLVVVATPADRTPILSVPVLSLSELAVLSTRLVEGADELWWFCRAWERRPHQSATSGELLEVWPGADYPPPHLAPVGDPNRMRWRDALGNSRLEQLLAQLRLAPTWAWDLIEHGENGRSILVKFHPLRSVQVVDVSPPLAVLTSDAAAMPERALRAAADTVAWLISRLPAQYGALTESMGDGRPVIVAVEGETPPSDWAFDPEQDLGDLGLMAGQAVVSEHGHLLVVLRIDPRISLLELQHRGGMQLLMADAIAGTLARHAEVARDASPVTGFMDAARALPLYTRVDLTQPQPQRTAADAVRPVEPSGPADAHVRQRLATKLVEAGVANGTYVGTAARDVESQVIHPAVAAELAVALSRYSAQELIEFTCDQLERAAAYRLAETQRLQRRARLPAEAGALGRVAHRIDAQGAQQSRALEIVLAATLQNPPQGISAPVRLEWEQVVAWAAQMLHSGIHSELFSHGLNGELHVTAAGSVRREATQAPVDLAAWQQAQASRNAVAGVDEPDPDLHGIAGHRFGDDGHLLPNRSELAEDEDLSSQWLVDAHPELGDVDDRFASAYGCHLQDILGALVSLEDWPVATGATIALKAPDDIAGFVAERTGAQRERAAAAITLLTLERPDRHDTFEHWELERRANRLAVRPLVPAPDGRLVVMPWQIASTLSVWLRYLGDMRSPWPDSATDADVRDAFRRARQRRNHALEDDVADALASMGLHVVRRVKKPQVIGLAPGVLPGEIDAVAIDAKRRTIWVVEVKDPQEVFSGMQIEQSIRDFLHPRRGWVAKLRRRAAVIEAHADAVVTALLGSNAGAGEWLVEPLMITRRLVPAAFTPDPGVRFLTTSDLGSAVTLDDD